MLVHRYWTGPGLPPCVSATSAVHASQYGALRDWTDETLPPRIKRAVDRVEDYVPEAHRPRHRANVARLLLLQEFGGLWVDHDLIIISLPSAEMPWTAWSGSRICSAVLAFEKGDSRLALALENVTPSDSSVTASGEGMLTDVWGGERIPYYRLPFNRDGSKDRAGTPWAVHLWSTGC